MVIIVALYSGMWELSEYLDFCNLESRDLPDVDGAMVIHKYHLDILPSYGVFLTQRAICHLHHDKGEL